MAFSRVTIKYNGEFHEFDLTDMDIPLEGATDQQILTATREHLEGRGVTVSNFNGYVVDPPQAERLSGLHDDKTVLNIRPTATYG